MKLVRVGGDAAPQDPAQPSAPRRQEAAARSGHR
eukprot:CAMPEP_0197916682 /NCGR_PEP_ID=MMETSP1439-20131203/82438_1 /TAXON_ID=66791 /ORGANISM="Gonyaulax spinifera, Strain CCMP409" /LENGTH=33 /DNA_ID= /DNA_START= /DNA_END= /DNA_ORIENTATION=